MNIHVPSGLAAIADAYDGFVIDQWGVLHDGGAPYPGAVAALQRLRAAGKRVVILSNAPRTAAHIARRMAGLGFGPELYDAIVSSGDLALDHFATRRDPFYAALGEACVHVGWGAERSLLEAARLREVAVEEAGFVFLTGAGEAHSTVADFEPLLRAARGRDLPLVCANPDRVGMDNGRKVICPGALAVRYVELGGTVRYHGKPHPEIYAIALAALGVADRARILAIGDSLEHDIAGAATAGLASALVTAGIHRDEVGDPPAAEQLAAAFAQYGATPTLALPGFRW